MRRLSNFSLFILSLFTAMVILLCVLGVYFSSSRIDDLLTKKFTADDFYAVDGSMQKQKNNVVFQVNANSLGSSSLVSKNIAIESYWYDRIEVVFFQKPSLQSLLLTVKSIKKETHDVVVREVPILYTDNLVSRFSLDKLVDPGDIVTSIELSTPKLVSPYQLNSIKIIAKKYSFISFFSLLVHDISSSSNLLDEPSFLLISSKLLLIIFFIIVASIFLCLMAFVRRPLSVVWWWVLIVLWLILDMRYLHEKKYSTQAMNITTAITTSQILSTMRYAKAIEKHDSEVS